MTQPITATVKITGPYAEKIRLEAAERRMSMNALTAEYAMRGVDSAQVDDSQLAGFERRIAATVLAARSDTEALQAEVDVIAVMLDALVKLMLVHLPEPGEEREAINASALSRYEKFIQQVASNGFEKDRPLALIKIGKLIQQRIAAAEENR